MTGRTDFDNVVRLADHRWRRPQRPRTRMQCSLALLEPAQRDAVFGLLDTFAPLAADFWSVHARPWPACGSEVGRLPVRGTPLADVEGEALVTLCLEAGYTIGTAAAFKAVLPHFLAAAFAWPLESWIIDPDLLKAKLETLNFETWPAAERRAVAYALALYAAHEIAMAEGGPGAEDEALVATKAWAELALATAN